jgi:outer membrane protein
MIKHLTLFLCLALLSAKSYCQDKWDLKRCVEFAIANNISVRQSDIDARTAELTYNQSKSAQYGNASGSTQLGLNFGRSIDPTTNLFTTSQSLYQGINLQGSITLFNWFTLRRAVESNRYYYQAQTVNIDKVKNDITLNVAAAYLQALLSREQVSLGSTKLELTQHQLNNTKKLVEAGSVPELNAAELEAQFATDTAALINAQETYDINVLQLKAILNLDAAAAFELDTPPVEAIPVEPIAELQPDIVYAIAVGTFPQQKMNDLRILSAEKNVQYFRGQLYPSLFAYGSLGDNFANDLRGVNVIQGADAVTSLYALNGGAQYEVYQPTYSQEFVHQPLGKVFTGYGTQLSDNFRQQVGIQLSVPIFNGNAARINYKKAKLNVQTANLQKQSDLLTLKQNIYQAYYNAVASFEKFQAGKTAVGTAERSFDLSTKRYNIGLLNTIDYLTNQNNLFTARINQLSAQYDYVFRMKVLEYYKGLGIKL